MSFAGRRNRGTRRLAVTLLAAIMVFTSVLGPAAYAWDDATITGLYQSRGSTETCSQFSEGYVWGEVDLDGLDSYYNLCVDKNGRAVMMMSEEFGTSPSQMENGYTHIEYRDSSLNTRVATMDKDGNLVNAFSGRDNNFVATCGYGYILTVETPNSSGFDRSAGGTCRYKLHDPAGDVVFEREYEGNRTDLPADWHYYGGGVFSVGNEFYFAKTGVTRQLDGVDIPDSLSFETRDWCISTTQSDGADVLLVMNTDGEWWTEPLPEGENMSRGIVWEQDGEIRAYDMGTRQWYTLDKYYADRVKGMDSYFPDREIGIWAWKDRIVLEMQGDDKYEYFALFDTQWNMISLESAQEQAIEPSDNPMQGEVIGLSDGTLLVRLGAYNEWTPLSQSQAENRKDIYLYDAGDGTLRGMLTGEAVPCYNNCYVNNGVIAMDDFCFYDSSGNYLFSVYGVDMSRVKDLTQALQDAWTESEANGGTFVTRLGVTTAPELMEDSAEEAGYGQDWYTQIGESGDYYRNDNGDTIVLLRSGDTITVVTETSSLASLVNSYDVTISMVEDDGTYLYWGITYPGDLRYYPDDGTITIAEGSKYYPVEQDDPVIVEDDAAMSRETAEGSDETAEQSSTEAAGYGPDWYTSIGTYGEYYCNGYEEYPGVLMLSYSGDMVEVRTEDYSLLNDYDVNDYTEEDGAYLYQGVTYPDELRFYPDDGSISISGGTRYQPLFRHGTEYPLPESFYEEWYADMGQTTYAQGGDGSEISLHLTANGDGTFTASLFPTDAPEQRFEQGSYEGTPANGVYYESKEGGGLYYYPEINTVFLVMPDGWVDEFWLS